MEPSWREMELHFRGPLQQGRVVFSTGTHVEKNLELERNVKTKVPYYALRFEGLNDYVSKIATPEIIRDHPREFAKYEDEIARGIHEPYDGYGEEKAENCAVPFPNAK